MESRSQADSEAADVDEDRDKGNTKEIANKLKGPGRPHLTASALRPRRGRGLPVGGEEAGARRAQDTAAELQAPSSAPTPGHGSQGEGQQGCKALEVAKREALKRAEIDQFKATLLQHNNNVELLELRYRTGVQTRGSSGLRGFAIASTQNRATPSTPSARSSSTAWTQKEWGPPPRHLSVRARLLPRPRAARMDLTSLRPRRVSPRDSPAFVPTSISALVRLFQRILKARY